jgi:hypothetical protein
MSVAAAAFILIALAGKYVGPVAGALVAFGVLGGCLGLWFRLKQTA